MPRRRNGLSRTLHLALTSYCQRELTDSAQLCCTLSFFSSAWKVHPSLFPAAFSLHYSVVPLRSVPLCRREFPLTCLEVYDFFLVLFCFGFFLSRAKLCRHPGPKLCTFIKTSRLNNPLRIHPTIPPSLPPSSPPLCLFPPGHHPHSLSLWWRLHFHIKDVCWHGCLTSTLFPKPP